MASTLTLRLNDEADEVEEMLVNPWARWNEDRHGGERAGRRRSNGGAVASQRLRRTRGMSEWSRAEAGVSAALA